MPKQKLELTWIGKENRPRLEPRILLEDSAKSHHASFRVSQNDLFDNRLIFGDNLLALKALEQEFSGKIKCIYIDPPYNTGSAFTHYDDGVEHSLWLSKPGISEKIELAPDEWLLSGLVRELEVLPHQIRLWIHKHYVHWRKSPVRGYYIVWADADELDRLRKLHDFAKAHPGTGMPSYPGDLITPKVRKVITTEHSPVQS